MLLLWEWFFKTLNDGKNVSDFNTFCNNIAGNQTEANERMQNK